MAVRTLDTCPLSPYNECLRVCIQNTIMSLEGVVTNLQGIVSDIGILVRQIEDVTNKLEQRNARLNVMGDSEWKQRKLQSFKTSKQSENLNIVTRNIISSKTPPRSSEKRVPSWTVFNGYLPSLQAGIVNCVKEENISLSTVSSGNDVTFDERHTDGSELCNSIDWRCCNYKYPIEREPIIPKVLSHISEVDTKNESYIDKPSVNYSYDSSNCDIYEEKMEQELESLMNYYTDESDSDRDCEDYWLNDVGGDFVSDTNSSVSSIPYSEELVLRYNKDISTWTTYKFVHLSDSESLPGSES
ncbi:hypothetical protein CHS0354_022017 [Potamilus streckersoni]|uniref:Uncharacterized protein n=1 Tax=Potamilus streckersoni TaxID=2493646 RepID=A0AAE0T276_9BIVA|nr:hypothetical protein CHS0354_022017 [Potamilus streckersoni]